MDREPDYQRRRQAQRDEVNLRHAEEEATMAVCTRRQVGAVIVAGSPPRIIGTGYNGTGPGKPHCSPEEKGCERGMRSREEVPPGGDYNAPGWRCSGLHAEHNAVLQAVEAFGRAALQGATIYITDEPCTQCEVLIEAMGISRIVTRRRLMLERRDDRDPELVKCNRNRYPVDDPPVCERSGCGHVLALHWDGAVQAHRDCKAAECKCPSPLRPR